ncbi:predicted protein [Uncinocarpus reesii 1704]|uniref:GED domain-containing protein n=1 Tax=Uncinocarpus reesii (strain UAMH 1704) TaxID=336963 RepID=C4JM46_UNCRE|nr:uncharacterized protein UREG_03904 [Uncinocarpus reesii 1704]EEP79058.1 predicted protein [Uncinocarpus reesii 1704]
MANVEHMPLNLLQAEGPAELLSRIDELRNLGFRHRICLPQLVVCGHQGCGKTSVFQAITGISFPVGHGARTRFAIEVIFRRSPEVSTRVKIRPGVNASPDHQHRLQTFSTPHNWLEDVSQLITDAEQFLGLSKERQYSQDVLQLEVSGPSLPDLTVIDLPGLLQDPNGTETAEDVALVRELTEAYTNNPRSIVLAVLSANMPLAQHSVIRLTAPCKSRTMGIITKPDVLDPDSSTLATFHARVKYQDIPLRLGWHVLKNVDTNHKDAFGLNRDETESLFFSSSIPWRTLSPNSIGIDSLRDRLNKVLLAQVELQLSMLSTEIQQELEIQRESLHQLGPDMLTAAERRLHITTIGEKVQKFTRDAVLGEYTDPYFRHHSNESVRRLRSVLRKWAEDFAVDMRQRGHSHYIYEDTSLNVIPAQGFADDPQPISKSEYISGILQLLKSNNVHGISGLANSQVICELFVRHSLKWDKITKAHVSEIWKKVKRFLDGVLHHVAGSSTSNAIMREIINCKMEERLRKTNSKVDELLVPYRRMMLSTLNEQLIFKLRHIRRESSQKIDPHGASDDMNLSICNGILDCMQSYYSMALGVFLDNVAGLAVESCLIEGIENIMSPTRISQMTDGEIERLAADSNEVRNARARIARKVKVFEVTAAACMRCQMAALESSAQNYNTLSDESAPNSPTFGSDFSSQKDSSSFSDVEGLEKSTLSYSPSKSVGRRRSNSSSRLLVFPSPGRIQGEPSHIGSNNPASSAGSNTSSPTWPSSFDSKQSALRSSYIGSRPVAQSGTVRTHTAPARIPSPELVYPGNSGATRFYTHGRALSADKIDPMSRDLLTPLGFSYESTRHARTLSAERIMPPLPEATVFNSRHARSLSADKFNNLPAPPPRSPARTLSLSILTKSKITGHQPLRRRLSKLKPGATTEEKVPSISLPFNFQHHGAVPASGEPAQLI